MTSSSLRLSRTPNGRLVPVQVQPDGTVHETGASALTDDERHRLNELRQYHNPQSACLLHAIAFNPVYLKPLIDTARLTTLNERMPSLMPKGPDYYMSLACRHNDADLISLFWVMMICMDATFFKSLKGYMNTPVRDHIRDYYFNMLCILIEKVTFRLGNAGRELHNWVRMTMSPFYKGQMDWVKLRVHPELATFAARDRIQDVGLDDDEYYTDYSDSEEETIDNSGADRLRATKARQTQARAGHYPVTKLSTMVNGLDMTWIKKNPIQAASLVPPPVFCALELRDRRRSTLHLTNQQGRKKSSNKRTGRQRLRRQVAAACSSESDLIATMADKMDEEMDEDTHLFNAVSSPSTDATQPPTTSNGPGEMTEEIGEGVPPPSDVRDCMQQLLMFSP